MTTLEFSNAFDTLLNSYSTLASFGNLAFAGDITLDEYEKSVFLTLALDIIVKQYFQGTQIGDGFDDSIRRQMDFSSLVTVDNCYLFILNNEGIGSGITLYDDRSLIFKLPTYIRKTLSGTKYPTKVLLILNEKLIIMSPTGVKMLNIIVPINYKEYDRLMTKAFSLPLKKLAWRLILEDVLQDSNNSSSFAEVIPTDAFINSKGEDDNIVYRLRYIRRPRPIILTNLNLEDGNILDIDGYSDVSECELNPILHMDILNKAVEIALSTRGRGLQQQTPNQL